MKAAAIVSQAIFVFFASAAAAAAFLSKLLASSQKEHSLNIKLREREREAKKPIKFLLLNKIPIKLKSCSLSGEREGGREGGMARERERETTGLIMLLFPTNILGARDAR